jgi:hypothetical protein
LRCGCAWIPFPRLRLAGDDTQRYLSVIPGRSDAEGRGIHGAEPHLLSPPHKGEEGSLTADLRIMKPISGLLEMGGEEGFLRLMS